MIEMRRSQLSFGDGLIAEEVSDLRDHWMAAADRVLADTEIITCTRPWRSAITKAAAAAVKGWRRR